MSLGGGLLLGACARDASSPPQGGAASGMRFLAAGDTEGYARATQAREFTFPEDHGSHPEFRTEWWYFTGNVFAANKRHFGFELTFFRMALSPPELFRGASAWATQQVWMAHFALTDTKSQTFSAGERLSRGAIETAGATASPFRVWVEDWSATAPSGTLEEGLRLQAALPEGSIDLRLQVLKSAVPQGDRGLDAKGAAPGNASYYYSLPRFTVAGGVNGETVEGLAWMDREWSTSALEDGIVGWDWFALQLSDGSDLMLYRLRNDAGDTAPYSGGSLVESDGAVLRFGADEFVTRAAGHWTSPSSGSRYPVHWTISIAHLNLELEIAPLLEDQELELSVRYWEGAVRVSGSARGLTVTGYGYLELAGY